MRNKVKHWLLISWVIVMGFIVCAPGQAAEVDLSINGHVTNVSTGEVESDVQSLTTPDPNTPATITNHSLSLTSGGLAEGSAAGSLATLKVYSHSYYPYTGNTSYATSDNMAQFRDTGSAASTLFTLSMVITGSFSPPYTGYGDLSAEAVGTFRITDSTTGNGVLLHYDSINSGLPATLTGTIITAPGDTISVYGSIEAFTYINGLVADPYRNAEVDVAKTAHFYIDQADGTPFIGSTGYDYSSPATAPIPGALWLLGSGLVGLAGLRRKFRS